MSILMKTLIAAVLLLTALSVSAQVNATINCPFNLLEPDGSASTDDGSGNLVVTAGTCTTTTNAGVNPYAYMTTGWSYLGSPIVLQHAIDISDIDGFTVTDGRAAGWIHVLEVSIPAASGSAVKKRFVLHVNSVPPSGAMTQFHWNIPLHLPVGTTLAVEAYSFANNASTCVSNCYASARWTLQ